MNSVASIIAALGSVPFASLYANRIGPYLSLDIVVPNSHVLVGLAASLGMPEPVSSLYGPVHVIQSESQFGDVSVRIYTRVSVQEAA